MSGEGGPRSTMDEFSWFDFRVLGEFSWFIFECTLANVEWARRWQWMMSELVVGGGDESSGGSVGRRWLFIVGLSEKKKRGYFDWVGVEDEVFFRFLLILFRFL